MRKDVVSNLRHSYHFPLKTLYKKEVELIASPTSLNKVILFFAIILYFPN